MRRVRTRRRRRKREKKKRRGIHVGRGSLWV